MSIMLSITYLTLVYVLVITDPAVAIVGGDFAKENQYTYTVSLQINNKHFCGGGIIGDEHVITAAHCVMEFDGIFLKYVITVVIGTVDLKKLGDSVMRIPAEKIYVPTYYRPQEADFTTPFQLVGDIAIIKLREPIDFAKNPSLIKLRIPQDSSALLYTGEKPTIAGFGVNKAKLVIDPKTGKKQTKAILELGKLKYAKTSVLSNDECVKITEMNGPIRSSHMCARVKQRWWTKPQSICSGDSGGPLVLNGNTVVGVLSTGPTNCDESVETGVYTRTSEFSNFIRNAMQDKKGSFIRRAIWYLMNENCDNLSPVLVEE